ncbi:DUF5131 family protein [Sphingomonas sp. GB1N7]|uniref:DUF5131 family protein n=1 Tax=Parasphingomonas caseinilytica TaxID=3096158 RepID=UPI002FCC079A
MAGKTEISWTESTWNPFFGCTKVGPGCDNCYAILEAHRKTFNLKLPAYFGSGVTQVAPEGVDWTGVIGRNSAKVWSLPENTKKPTVWFVNSMSDLFHEAISDAEIVSVFEIMNRCPQHTFQVLTKRANRMLKMSRAGLLKWTPNIWAGVSIEDDKFVTRAKLLREVPAQVRFISAEPLLGPLPSLDLTDIDWLIVGGESGPGARPMDPAWARDLRDRAIQHQLDGSKLVFHFKQWGAFGQDGIKRSKAANGHHLDGAEWHDSPSLKVSAVHGAGSIEEFRSYLTAERSEDDYATIKVGNDPARIYLRDTILTTLRQVSSMEAQQLCIHDLRLVGLDPRQKQNVNIHAWALSDLVRKKAIRSFPSDTGVVNRRGNAVLEKHYEVVS